MGRGESVSTGLLEPLATVAKHGYKARLKRREVRDRKRRLDTSAFTAVVGDGNVTDVDMSTAAASSSASSRSSVVGYDVSTVPLQHGGAVCATVNALNASAPSVGTVPHRH